MREIIEVVIGPLLAVVREDHPGGEIIDASDDERAEQHQIVRRDRRARVPRPCPERREVEGDEQADQWREPADPELVSLLKCRSESAEHLGQREAEQQTEQRKDEIERVHVRPSHARLARFRPVASCPNYSKTAPISRAERSFEHEALTPLDEAPPGRARRLDPHRAAMAAPAHRHARLTTAPAARSSSPPCTDRSRSAPRARRCWRACCAWRCRSAVRRTAGRSRTRSASGRRETG